MLNVYLGRGVSPCGGSAGAVALHCQQGQLAEGADGDHGIASMFHGDLKVSIVMWGTQ